MSVGKRLREARRDRKLTATKLAELAEVSPAFISRWENDQRGESDRSSIEGMIRVLRVLAISANWLFFEYGLMNLEESHRSSPEREDAEMQARREGIWHEAIRSRLNDPVTEIETKMPGDWWLLQIKSREIEMIQEALRRNDQRKGMTPVSGTTRTRKQQELFEMVKKDEGK